MAQPQVSLVLRRSELWQLVGMIDGRAVEYGQEAAPGGHQLGRWHRGEALATIELDRELLCPAPRQPGSEKVEAVRFERWRMGRALDVEFPVVDGDDVVGESASAQGDVTKLTVEIVGGEQERAVAGHPLGLVHC